MPYKYIFRCVYIFPCVYCVSHCSQHFYVYVLIQTHAQSSPMAHTDATDLHLVSFMTKPHTNSRKTDLLDPEGERRQHGQLPAMSELRAATTPASPGHSRPTTNSLLSTCALSYVPASAHAYKYTCTRQRKKEAYTQVC